MSNTDVADAKNEPLIPRYVVVLAAFISAGAIIAVALLGPLWLDEIHYRTSQSGIWQVQGADFVNLVLIGPILIIGGVLYMQRRESARYFLILSPVTLMYTGLSLGIGQEWGNPLYIGNVEQYAWLYLILIIGGLVLLVSSMPLFSEKDAPDFKPRSLKIYVGVMMLFLLIFAAMWLSELAQVMAGGDVAGDSYSQTPTLWWTVRYLDLGFTIPLGFLSLFLLLTKPKKAYSLVLLFFGFFITLGTAVLSMAIMMTIHDDPQAQPGALPVFAMLAILSWVGLLYLVKDKLSGALSDLRPTMKRGD
jgi:hypothetical protein